MPVLLRAFVVHRIPSTEQDVGTSRRAQFEGKDGSNSRGIAGRMETLSKL